MDPHQDVRCMVVILGTVIVCGACVCIGIGLGFGVGCWWIFIVAVFGGKLMCVGFVDGVVVGRCMIAGSFVGDLRTTPIVCVSRSNTLDQPQTF